MNQELLNAIRGILKEELDPFKQDFPLLKQDVSALKQDVSEIKQSVARIDDKVDLLAGDAPGDVISMIQIMNTKLDDIKKDVEFTYRKTSMNELEIERLKRQ